MRTPQTPISRHLWPSAMLLPAAMTLCGGCGPRPHSAVNNLDLPGDESRFRSQLTTNQQKNAVEAFALFARDAEISTPPQPAPHGVRWSDVPLAVLYAADDTEMAVVTSSRHEWGYDYRLRTIEGRSARLIIRHRNPPKIYEAEATVGRFSHDHKREEQLLNALHDQLQAFGQKRR